MGGGKKSSSGESLSKSSPKTASDRVTFSSDRRSADSGAGIARPADDGGQQERPAAVAVRAAVARLRRLQRQVRSTAVAPGADRSVFEEALQVVGQRAGGRVAVRRLVRNRLQDDRFQVAGDGRVEPPRPGRLALRSLPQQLARAQLAERGLEREQLVERQAQAVDVAPVVGLAPECLGGEIPQRADHVTRCGQVVVTGELRQAEVGDPDAIWCSSIRRLAGLMSRWRMPWSWAYWIASAACTPTLATNRQ